MLRPSFYSECNHLQELEWRLQAHLTQQKPSEVVFWCATPRAMLDAYEHFSTILAHRSDVSLHRLPVLHPWGLERYAAAYSQRRQRIDSLSALSRFRLNAGLSAQTSQPDLFSNNTNNTNNAIPIIFATPLSLRQRTQAPEAFAQRFQRLHIGQDLDLSPFVEQLDRMGYVKREEVSEVGEYAWRGQVLDLCTPSAGALRIDSLFSELHAIRTLSLEDQSSRESLSSAWIGPAEEFVSATAASDRAGSGNKRENGARPESKSGPENSTEPKQLPLSHLKERIHEICLQENVRWEEQKHLYHQLETTGRFRGIELLAEDLFEHTGCALDYLNEACLHIELGSTSELKEAEQQALSSLSEAVAEDRKAQKWTLGLQNLFGPASLVEPDVLASDAGHRTRRNLWSCSGEHFQSLRHAFKHQPPQWPGQPEGHAGSTHWSLWLNQLQNQSTEKNTEPSCPTLVLPVSGQASRNLVSATLSQAEVLFHPENTEDDLPALLRESSLAHEPTKPGVPHKLDAPLKCVQLCRGKVSKSFYHQASRSLVVADHEVLGLHFRSKLDSSALNTHATSSHKKLMSYIDRFAVDDYVVHKKHGICLYKGLCFLDYGDEGKEYLHLEFRDGDKVYLPVESLGLIDAYQAKPRGEASSVGPTPELDRLGSEDWQKRKDKAWKSAEALALKLLDQQAKRSLIPKTHLGERNAQLWEFEEAFPYAETPDQLQAIADIYHDMESEKPMDRLLCGDAGFGKTEVAMRAAMRAVSAGKQVLLLVPTTILAYQHLMTFQRRFADSGVRVEGLNRMVKPSQAKQIIAAFQAGTCDILIGTHTLLNKELSKDNIGLIIIDEEQKFGVRAKNTLRNFCLKADLLTITATPIPRTLNQAVLGVIDISVLTTAPSERRSVKTYLVDQNDSTADRAIAKELERGGQAFVINHRAAELAVLAERYQRQLPKAKVHFVHGQMEKKDFEQRVLAFMRGELDVLIATTIVESGIDIPNMNTIVVRNAHMFGLAQLYQLRGRVGRAAQQGHSYFLVPGLKVQPEEVKERLNALERHQEFGAGFRIASSDLEQRGGGNLLGAEQSGHQSSVGLTVYSQLVKEAVQRWRKHLPDQAGDQVTADRAHHANQTPAFDHQNAMFEPDIHLQVPAKIPKSYIKEDSLRLEAYRTLFGAMSEQEIADALQLTEDRFGPMPKEFQCLAQLSRLRIGMLSAGIESLNARGSELTLRYHRPKSRTKNTASRTHSTADHAQSEPLQFSIEAIMQLQRQAQTSRSGLEYRLHPKDSSALRVLGLKKLLHSKGPIAYIQKIISIMQQL